MPKNFNAAPSSSAEIVPDAHDEWALDSHDGWELPSTEVSGDITAENYEQGVNYSPNETVERASDRIATLEQAGSSAMESFKGTFESAKEAAKDKLTKIGGAVAGIAGRVIEGYRDTFVGVSIKQYEQNQADDLQARRVYAQHYAEQARFAAEARAAERQAEYAHQRELDAAHIEALDMYRDEVNTAHEEALYENAKHDYHAEKAHQEELDAVHAEALVVRQAEMDEAHAEALEIRRNELDAAYVEAQVEDFNRDVIKHEKEQAHGEALEENAAREKKQQEQEEWLAKREAYSRQRKLDNAHADALIEHSQRETARKEAFREDFKEETDEAHGEALEENERREFEQALRQIDLADVAEFARDTKVAGHESESLQAQAVIEARLHEAVEAGDMSDEAAMEQLNELIAVIENEPKEIDAVQESAKELSLEEKEQMEEAFHDADLMTVVEFARDAKDAGHSDDAAQAWVVAAKRIRDAREAGEMTQEEASVYYEAMASGKSEATPTETEPAQEAAEEVEAEAVEESPEEIAQEEAEETPEEAREREQHVERLQEDMNKIRHMMGDRVQGATKDILQMQRRVEGLVAGSGRYGMLGSSDVARHLQRQVDAVTHELGRIRQLENQLKSKEEELEHRFDEPIPIRHKKQDDKNKGGIRSARGRLGNLPISAYTDTTTILQELSTARRQLAQLSFR